jgi:hypothetical protein
MSRAEKQIILLVSQEGESIDVPLTAARISLFVNERINPDQDAEEAQEIPIEEVRTVALVKVAEFCKRYLVNPFSDIPKVNRWWTLL